MNNKFIMGILTGAACSLIAAAVLFTVYLSVEGNGTGGTAVPTQSIACVEATPSAGAGIASGSGGVLSSVSDEELLDKLDYIKGMIEEYSLYGATEEEMLDGIYRGMLYSIQDAYSEYYNADDMNALRESSSGIYCGIGALVSQNVYTGIITVVKPFKGGPAYTVGMLKDDRIIRVEDMEVTGMDLSEVVSYMKGEEGTLVHITVLRGDSEEEITFEISRAKIEVPTVEYEMLDNKIGYILVSEFDEITVEQFDAAVTALENDGMRALVLDLRDNPGGLVDSAVSMLDRLLPKGLVVYTEDKNGVREEEYAKDKIELKVPLVLLMNENSASASEIFAGAIQDYGKGTIVGTRSYGKGIVQIIATLDDGSGIKFTISQYFTPNGNAVHGIGIVPDVEVELDEELQTLSEIPKDQDNQLQEAIRLLEQTFAD